MDAIKKLEHGTAWTKSSWSEGADDCVEIAITPVVGLRDSKDPDGPTLCFNRSEWIAFLKGAKAGEFDIA
ncbi:DUF397 domain-containing protein [Actinomadura craniellae]|uniref:DUF397 domain-containing protein n=1 Tax=Actinomadura craniellae TaxID=2231787 RepID=A0A365HA96_9ACTN|nr:DUF397 domain-containing protein [Actinomadura craniellae]RAY15928.1 DUF397 domain-containing protein [Actinomadura craniellae]